MIDLSNLTPGQIIALLLAFLAGVVEFGKNLYRGFFGKVEERPAKRETAMIIAFAAFSGWVSFPLFGEFFTGLTLDQLHLIGVVAGFATSGAVTFAFNWGKKSEVGTSLR